MKYTIIKINKERKKCRRSTIESRWLVVAEKSLYKYCPSAGEKSTDLIRLSKMLTDSDFMKWLSFDQVIGLK